MQIENIILNYRKNISEIIRIIDNIDEKCLLLQSDKYIPDTLCHPIWTLGHLIGSAQGICEEMLVDHWLDENWTETYGQQSTPIGNPKTYKSKTELIQMLNNSMQRVETAFSALSETQLKGPMPDKRYHHIYPTLAHVLASILIEHTATHIKMISIWEYFVARKHEI